MVHKGNPFIKRLRLIKEHMTDNIKWHFGLCRKLFFKGQSKHMAKWNYQYISLQICSTKGIIIVYSIAQVKILGVIPDSSFPYNLHLISQQILLAVPPELSQILLFLWSVLLKLVQATISSHLELFNQLISFSPISPHSSSPVLIYLLNIIVRMIFKNVNCRMSSQSI